jgi:hypothetical protein
MTCLSLNSVPSECGGLRAAAHAITAATAETTGCELASHHAADSQPPDGSGSAVSCRAPRRCAPDARFQQCSVQRLFRPGIRHGRGNRQIDRHRHVVTARTFRTERESAFHDILCWYFLLPTAGACVTQFAASNSFPNRDHLFQTVCNCEHSQHMSRF